MNPTDQDIERTKAAHPGVDLHLLPFSDGAVIARAPQSSVWRKFVGQVANDKRHAPMALESLARSCVVWPAPAELDALLEARPGIAAAFGEALSKLAGAAEEIEAKKL